MVPSAKMQHGPLHRADFLLARLYPALRAESLNILAKSFLIAMDSPRADADNGAGGEMFATDLGAAGGNNTFEDESGGGVHAVILLDAGVHVG